MVAVFEAVVDCRCCIGLDLGLVFEEGRRPSWRYYAGAKTSTAVGRKRCFIGCRDKEVVIVNCSVLNHVVGFLCFPRAA